MKNSGFVISSDINEIINKRVTLWQEFEGIQSKLHDMDRLSSKLGTGSTVERFPELTDEKTPPSEIITASQHFHAELENISNRQKSVETYQGEIDGIIKLQWIMVAVVVFLVLFGVVSLLSNI